MAKKEVSLKNYVYLILIILITIGIVYYLYLWFSEYKEEVKKMSDLGNYLQVINYNDLENYIIENDTICMYVTNNDLSLANFENNLKKFLVEENLGRLILYLDVSSVFHEGKYELCKVEFNSVPLFVMFNNGKITSSYDIKQNKYDINKISSYLQSVGVIND